MYYQWALELLGGLVQSSYYKKFLKQALGMLSKKEQGSPSPLHRSQQRLSAVQWTKWDFHS